jgi:hypothetical protein
VTSGLPHIAKKLLNRNEDGFMYWDATRGRR